MFKVRLTVIVSMLFLQNKIYSQVNVRNNAVGIGTAAPTEKLHVVGRALIDANENVLTFNSSNTSDWQFLSFKKGGTGRTWLGHKEGFDFYIRPEQAGANIYLQPYSGKVVIESSQDNGQIGGAISLINSGKTNGGQVARDWTIYNMGSAYGNSLQFWAYSVNGCNDYCNPAVIFRDNGSVGIGVFPQYKLHVAGVVKAETYIADTPPHWPDYVFDTTYNLPPLQEVEKYIQQNHHLPNVPSAKKVKEDGFNLGDNQAVLLRKIEELTLYAIEQQKVIEELKTKMKMIEEKNKQPTN